ncbi:13020_t:CDS:1 [Cetraspora pellucida]|uniref:13020_t:CDS:1 n=1 Tax=Cetraspora pellucida TaxID=1433469 RepID=A0ACA9MCF7_9GLOM|nr:13020_t:CDS:1 [Cetraspora pellucida]
MHCAARTWNDLKIVNGVTHSYYQEAARDMGLFMVKNECILTMKEAVDSLYTPAQLRFLFVQLILDGALAVDLWQKFNTKLSADFKKTFQNNNHLAINTTLQHIASMLAKHGQHMGDFGLIEPQIWTQEVVAEYQHYSNYIKYK